MPCRTWREAVESLDAAIGPVTLKQRELGNQADTQIPADMPRIVAAVRLQLALAEELNLPSPRPVSDRYRTRLRILHRPSDPPISPQSEEEAGAWITYLRLVRRREALSELRIYEGDVIGTMAGEVAVVSSMGPDGRVYFKGGRGFGAWPDLISVVARRDDKSDSAAEARRQAENLAARRGIPSAWSVAKSQDLSEFITNDAVSEDDIAELEAAITAAADERPIQGFLENNRHILTALLGGNERYCIPQKRLGGEYIPDFIIGDVGSLGVRWVLIELETPRSGLYLKDGIQLDEKTWKGISQIMEWRNWLSCNIAYARRRRSENGLGLFDIHEKSDAVVLVGRRSQIPETKDAQRLEYRQSNNIQIHTYDWLLEMLLGALRHPGPPAGNPYLIPRGET